MSQVITPVRPGTNQTDLFVADVAYTATADAGGNVPHGLGAAPLKFYLCPLLSVAYAGRVSITAGDTTNLVLTKVSTAGSANNNAQVRVYAQRPHTIGM
jgi:hypothetical protein